MYGEMLRRQLKNSKGSARRRCRRDGSIRIGVSQQRTGIRNQATTEYGKRECYVCMSHNKNVCLSFIEPPVGVIGFDLGGRT